ncbi:hypothetical protein VTL71DRAFT_197 [Oculimacula yallundae]|uniref:F-box domain-containing protein n=1 Tax=Oculimacula yallundae TaxID=86028 RepID=A0ABR4CZC1_9HELO
MAQLSFTDLPGEIRNKIYNHLLILPSLSTPRLLGDPPLYPQILSVCRQVHEEGKQILYGCNTFLAHPNLLGEMPRLRLYYDTIHAKSLVSLIRRFHIRIRLDCDPNFSAEKAIKSFTGAEELTIEVFQAQFGSSGHMALKLFEGIRGVKRARIYGSVQAFPEYVQWLRESMMTPEGVEVEVFDKEKVGAQVLLNTTSQPSLTFVLRSSIMESQELPLETRSTTPESTQSNTFDVDHTSLTETRAPSSSTEVVSASEDSDSHLPESNTTELQGNENTHLAPILSRANAITELYRLAALLDVPIQLPSREPQNEFATFLTLPLDVRILIYDYLLVNPDLEEVVSITKHDSYGAHQAYRLSPVILRVCKQTQAEGTAILYGYNTFCLVCPPHNTVSAHMHEGIILSPLTRYSYDQHIPFVPISRFASVRKVEKWKVIMSAQAWDDYTNEALPEFFEVCRAFTRGQPRSIEIAIIPRGFEEGVVEYQDMEAALRPLKLLRGIQNLRIRDATPFEIPDCIDQDEDALEFVSNMEDHPILEVTLTLLAQSDDPIEKIFEMYEYLLHYVQSFEKLPQFKREMDLDENDGGFYGINDFPDGSVESDFLNYHLNPYKKPDWNHPVEASLKLAKNLANKEDSQLFKAERAFIIEYLEPQYQRIFAAASEMVSFVKAEKRSRGLLSLYYEDQCAYEEYPDLCASAMVLLDEYEAAFDRENPFHIKVQFRRYRSQYKRVYSAFGVGNTLLNDLNFAIDTKDYHSFRKFFPIAVDRLDDLFLEMLSARQKLFDWDAPSFNDRQCNIDAHTERCTEKIDWNSEEPSLAPASFDDYVPSEADESDQHSEEGQDNDESDDDAGSEDDEHLSRGVDSDNEEDDATSEGSGDEYHGTMEHEDDGHDEEVGGLSANEEVDEGAGPAEDDVSAILDIEDGEELGEGAAEYDHQTASGDSEVVNSSPETIQLQHEWFTDTSIHVMSATVQQFTGDWTFASLSAVQDTSNFD